MTNIQQGVRSAERPLYLINPYYGNNYSNTKGERPLYSNFQVGKYVPGINLHFKIESVPLANIYINISRLSIAIWKCAILLSALLSMIMIRDSAYILYEEKLEKKNMHFAICCLNIYYNFLKY